MNISKKMQDALNKQINRELFSSYLYLSMAAYFDAQNLSGFANWMKLQAKEEDAHAMKMYAYVNERGGAVTLDAIEAPEKSWKNPLAVFEAVYAHEIKVTKMINNLVKIARDESDIASEIFLQWFVTEQVEEEASADGIIQKLKLIEKVPAGIFMMDRELASRGRQ